MPTWTASRSRAVLAERFSSPVLPRLGSGVHHDLDLQGKIFLDPKVGRIM